MARSAAVTQSSASPEVPPLAEATLPPAVIENPAAFPAIQPVPFSPPAAEGVPQRCVPPLEAPRRAPRQPKPAATEAPRPAEITSVKVEPEHERIRYGCG